MPIDESLVDRLAQETRKRLARRGAEDPRRSRRPGGLRHRLISLRAGLLPGWADYSAGLGRQGPYLRIAVPAFRLGRVRKG